MSIKKHIANRLVYLRQCTEEERQEERTQNEFETLLQLEYAELTITHIAFFAIGFDGKDEYLLVERKDDDLTPEQAEALLLPLYYRDTRQEAGGYFCHTVLTMKYFDRTNACIACVQHRYDV